MRHGGQLHERQLLNVVDDLCRFVLHEVVNVEGKFFDETSDLARTINTFHFVSGTNSSTVKRPRGMMEKHV